MASTLAASLLLAACQAGPEPRATSREIEAAMHAAVANRPAPVVPERVSAALLPPLAQALPRPAAVPEQRFDLNVNNASVAQVFAAIGSGSRRRGWPARCRST
jgi:hypothetical protein